MWPASRTTPHQFCCSSWSSSFPQAEPRQFCKDQEKCIEQAEERLLQMSATARLLGSALPVVQSNALSSRLDRSKCRVLIQTAMSKKSINLEKVM
uniref:Uncharacterized protein n=1 Tax=Kalanchoe fedtschenkoi TaxID=63787 RepID=A0A7N0VI73_KALFE